MPPLDLLLPFFAASAVFACIPGPGMVYMAAQTAARGHRAGWLSAVGFHVGGLVHVCAAAFGLAILLTSVPVLYTAMKLAGAAYLIWLGVGYMRAAAMAMAADAGPVASGRALGDSLVVGVLNPKTAIFYLAFLPQFTDAAAAFPVWLQVLVLGAIVNAMFSLTDAVCIVVSQTVTKALTASRSARRLASRIGGGLLIGLGINLAVARH